MKLHLPSKLRHAVLACMATMVGIASTCATGSFVAGVFASQAQAVDIAAGEKVNWDGSQDNAHSKDTTVVLDDGRLVINGFKDGNPQGDASGANNTVYNESYKLGTLTVEAGGQLWFNITNQKVPSQTTNFKQVAGALTLKGYDFSADADFPEDPTPDDWRSRSAMVFYDGSYLFQDKVDISGHVYMYTDWGGSQTFTNLSSLSDDNSDVLEIYTNRTPNTKGISFTLAYNKDKPIDAFDGTIIIHDPYDDQDPNNSPDEMTILSIAAQEAVGSGVTYHMDGYQTALFLSAQNLYIPNVVSRYANIRSATNGAQVRQTIGSLTLERGSAYLVTSGGSVVWTINELYDNRGNLPEYQELAVYLWNGTESYKPNVVYLNTPNKTETDAAGNVTRKGFSGVFRLSDLYLSDIPTEKYGVYQDYIEIGHADALAEAKLDLQGDYQQYTYVSETGVINNDRDYSLENYAVAALNSTDVNIGGLEGTYLGVVLSGKAPVDGTENAPSTAREPMSSAATVTLHIGAIGDTDSLYEYRGEILKNVNIDKQGLGRQVIYNLENDSARYITVSAGTLELGSVGDFRRLSVVSGGRAEVGLSVSSKINYWGRSGKFVYFEAFDNGIDLSDATKISGNVVLTDKLYYRDNRQDYADDTITVTYLDSTRYAGDSLTLVDADLAVFNPVTGQAANLDKIKKITATENSSLVSASPEHHGLMSDPQITVGSDIVVQGYLTFMAHGSVYTSSSTGQLEYSALNTTYTGAISAQAHLVDGGEYETSIIYKAGYGTVTLSGDMSEYNQYLNVNDGTLVLDGSIGKNKSFTRLTVNGPVKAQLDLTNEANVQTAKFVHTNHSFAYRLHCETSTNIAAGTNLTITAENTILDDDANNKPGAYDAGTFVLANGTHTDIQVNGSLNMTRASFLSVTPVKTAEGEIGKKEINVNNGGVFNAKGLWLQSYSTDYAIESTINIHSGGTFNLGSEGIGHVDVNGRGAMKSVSDDHLIINFSDGSTLGVLDDATGWTTARSLYFNGMVTVNTQGYIVDEGSSANGSAKTITLGSVKTSADEDGLIKAGSGTLELGGTSSVNNLVVNDGFLKVAKFGSNYAVNVERLRTEGNGSLLFDLTNHVEVGQTSAEGQTHIVVRDAVEGIVNITVRAGQGVDMHGKTYGILASTPPSANKVNLIAMVDDGWYAEYKVNDNLGWGYVTVNYDATTKLGNDKLLTWATSEGESNFWGNSTMKNWKDSAGGDVRRFTNDSCVVFSEPGEIVTIQDTVKVTDKTIGGTPYAAMTVATSGYEFTGTGSIVGVGGTLKIEDGVHATFSNTGGVYFEHGVTLGDEATLRLEYLDDVSSNWSATVTGDGILEIATGGIRANVLTSVMGDSVGTVSLDNNTTIRLINNNPDEAAKLAAADKVVINKGSRLLVETDTTSELMAAGQVLSLAGAGAPSEDMYDYSSEAAITVGGAHTAAQIKADVELADDTTLYIGLGCELSFDAAFASNGHGLILADSGNYLGSVTGSNMGVLRLKNADSSTTLGKITAKQGTTLALDFADDTVVLENEIELDNARLRADNDASVSGPLQVIGSSKMRVAADKVLNVSSSISGSDDASVTLEMVGGNLAAPGLVVLSGDNTAFDGDWIVQPGHILQANHTNALRNSAVEGSPDAAFTTELQLGTASNTYYADGVTGALNINSVDAAGMMKTLALHGNGVYEAFGKLGKDVSIVMDGNGSQSFDGTSSFVDGYNGNITVKDGLLRFRNAPTSYDTIEIAGDEATLGIGYYDYDTPGNYGAYVPNILEVSTGQTLLISETGSMLNGNLKPMSGGQITLGTEISTWAAEGGLNMFSRGLILDTADKAALTVNLSAFLKAGDYVELFTHVGSLTIDGEEKDFLSELGMLEDYFDCDDINLARTKLEMTAAGTIRIKLVNDSDGQYYEYQGGTDGVWDYSTQAWALKDDKEASYKYAGGAAYFTNNTATVTLAEDIEAREMAVKNGNYTFVLKEGNDLTIRNRYYEMDDGVSTFVLEHAESTDANGNPISEGAKLHIKGGMGDIDNTVVRGDGDTANQLILGSKTALSGNSKFEDIYLFLDGENSKLDLGGTSATDVFAVGGEGTISANYGGLTISNKMNGTFVGSFVAGAENSAPGVNTLVIEEGDATKMQTFSNVTIDKSWNLVNNGSLDFKPTAESELNSMTLGADSKTILTVNTDQKQLLGLTALAVEDGADITLNSTGNAPIMSGEQTPGYSYKVLGSFEDDGSLDIAGDAVTINRGSGTAFLMVDKNEPITLKSIYNQETGHYDLVMVAKVDDSNQFAPYAEGETNAEAGAEMLWTQEAMTYINAEPNGDLAKTFNEIATMVTSTEPNGEQIREALASVAGSSTAVLGSAFSADVERQLKAIRNRTTTMGVGQCEVNENMPYYNAWINAEGNHRELDSDGLAAGYTHDSWGGTVGFDVDVTPSFTWGLALTAMYGDIETEGADKGEGDFDTMYLSAFARYAKNAWVHTFVATVGRADVTLSRTVNVGSTSYETEGETDGMAFGFMYEVGRVYALSEDGSTCWQPMFNVALRNSSISGYDEEGSDAGLSVGDQDFTTLTFGVGARLQTVMGENLYNRSSIFEARALLKFDAGDTEAETETALLNGNGVAQTVEGAEVGAFGVEIGAGVTIPVGAEGGAVFLDASAELRSGYTNINGTLGYRVNF